ncbi:MAG: glycoside hydrolase family 16 protein [Lachnospiraceae bacterium]|nr:glycoside hydrolase family 16 protein [Lachnospiraceae bacterium]
MQHAFILLLSLMLLTACTGPVEGTESKEVEESGMEQETDAIGDGQNVLETTKEDKAVAIEVNFTQGQPAGFECADGWCNGSVFNVTWRKSNVTFNEGNMQLIIDKDVVPANNVPYSGGEFRSKDFYGYGRYEVSMKAIKNDGVVSSFFTYTGPSDNNPWDEIDVEVLGKDTTKVQLNYYTNGKGEHEYMHDLGFDAAEDFHTYAFEWHEDKIIWFVDGAQVHQVTEEIPVTKGKIMMNAWCGIGVNEWLKPFDDSNLPLTAEYQWIKYTPFE